jgi:repressor LexA
MHQQIFENEFIRQGILLGDEFPPAVACGQTEAGAMQIEVGEVLRRIEDEGDLTQKVLAKKIGSSQGTISKWASGKQSPNKAKWDKVLDLIRKEPKLRALKADMGLNRPTKAEIPVMGRIGAGANIDPDLEQVGPDGLYEINLPFVMPVEAIAFEVSGESMLPKYDPGEVIVVTRDQIRNTESFLGQLCAVRTEDGRRFLKQLMPGSKPGFYRLESFNAKPIVDVVVEWVGEILATIPATQVSVASLVVEKRRAGGRKGR